jgi:multidrug efflux system outer membrane protein
MLEPAPPPARVLRTWQEALLLLRQSSTGLRTSRARITQAEAQARVALAPALPSLDANAGIQRDLLRKRVTLQFLDVRDDGTVARASSSSLQPDPATTYGAGLALRVPLLNRSAWFNRGTALDSIENARLSALDVERREVALVANSIVTVVTAERLAEVSRVSLQSALSTLDLNRRRAELGASSAIDVLRAEQEASISRGQVVSADEALLRAREDLGLALGSSEAYGVVPDIRLDALAADARASCRVETDVRARPDVRAAQSALSISERGVRAVNFDYWPTVDAVSNLDYLSEGRDPYDRRVTWTIGAVLNWSLYEGGARSATSRVRSAEADVARAQLTDTERRARLEVTQAFRAVKTAEANQTIARKTRDIASENARLSRVAFLNGSGTSFDLVDTARQLREAELDLAIKEFEVLRARIAAFLALATCRV